MALLASGGSSVSAWTSPFHSSSSAQSVDSACGVVRSDRGRAHSPDSSACFGVGRRTDRRSGSASDLRVQALPTVAHRPSESVLLRFTECFHPLSSSWYFVHPGTGRTQVLTLFNGHYPCFMLLKCRFYFRCEYSRQSILDAWTCLDFCEHAQARRVCLLFHGSASCVHGKRCWRFLERVHLVKRRKKCSCDRWSVRLTRVTSWMSWESGPALKDLLGSSKFCAILLTVISDMVQAKTMGNAGT